MEEKMKGCAVLCLSFSRQVVIHIYNDSPKKKFK